MARHGHRLSTGSDTLDGLLGGGLLPGTLTVVLGATGVGKTQLGVRFLTADAAAVGSNGSRQNAPDGASGGASVGRSGGALIDFNTRGDDQAHNDYAERLMGRPLTWGGSSHPTSGGETDGLTWQTDKPIPPETIFDGPPPPEAWHYDAFDGRRASRTTMSEDQWHDSQCRQADRLASAGAFLMAHLAGGTRRFVFDGIEPVAHATDSLQLAAGEVLFQRVLRAEHDWAAREVLRHRYRQLADRIEAAAWSPGEVATVMLVTSRETMLEALLARPMDEGDLLATANTVILMGRTTEPGSGRLGRGLFVVKHRGSRCADEIVPYTIDDTGLVFSV